MLFSSYDYGPLIDVVFVALIFAAFLGLMCGVHKVAKKRHVSIQCYCCANRGGAYPPKNCPNRCCKFYV